MNPTTEFLANAAISGGSAIGAACGAYAATYPGFKLRADQILNKLGPLHWINGARGSMKPVALLVGGQICFQKSTTWLLTPDGETPSKIVLIGSSLLAGAATTPAAASLNAVAADKHWIEGIRLLSAKEAAYLFTRESGFVLTLAAKEPLYRVITPYTGESPVVEKTTAFVLGIIGAFLTQPADVGATLLQSGRPLPTTLGGWYRGYLPRMGAVGLFGVLYSELNPGIEKFLKNIADSEKL